VTRLTTARLVLETLTADEARAIRAGDRAGRDWAEDYPFEGDAFVAGVIGEAGEHYDESAPLGVLQVRLAATGAAVGGIGFLSAPTEDGSAEVGYGFVTSVRGQGLATEALEAVLAHAAEQGLRTVVAMTAVDNIASQRVLERCGFVRGETVDTEDEGPMIRWARSVRDPTAQRPRG
jgi:RimJ/RimL family protein N-acetyltransferase